MAHEEAERTDTDHHENRCQEDVGRNRKRDTRFLHAAQVDCAKKEHEADGNLNSPRSEFREGRNDVVGTRRNRYGNGHNVVK